MTSSDGVNWVVRRSPTTDTLYDVAYGNGLFVAVGGLIKDWFASSLMNVGTIITSRDGISWSSCLTGFSNGLRKTVYGGGQFVAMGDEGTVLTSADGVNWSRRGRLGEWALGPARMAYGNGRFV